MNRRRAVWLGALLVLTGCVASTPPGVFVEGGGFRYDVLDLKPDGTFTFEAVSDDGGAFYRAEGTWRRESSDSIVTEITKITLGAGLTCPPLQRQKQVWRITRRGLVQETPAFRPWR